MERAGFGGSCGYRRWWALAIAVGALATGARDAKAAVVFDNFDTGAGGFHPTDNLVAASVFDDSFSGQVAIRAAVRFEVVGGPYSLDSITLPISLTSTVPDDLLRVRLTADAGGAPGATLEVLSEGEDIWPPLTNPFTTTTQLDSVLHPLLETGASYWIVVEPNAVPASSPPYFVDARWFRNSVDRRVSTRQQQTVGGLPGDPWPGSSFDEPVAFRVDGTSLAPPLAILCTPIDAPGNACDPQGVDGCFGGVPYTYGIGVFEVSNTEYAAFLDAVAKTDPNGLYNTQMFGILRTVSSGSWTYAPLPGFESMPVNAVTFYNALRFANWLHNGQPSGAQGPATTEDGAYTFLTPTSVGPRKAGALYALTSEDEWYKAAYYDPISSAYFSWPTGSNTMTTCSAPTLLPDSANCDLQAGGFTDGGSYPGSATLFGTYDQGGNAWEWNEAEIEVGGVWHRGVRGGALHEPASWMEASVRPSTDPADPPGDVNAVGFRVTCVPEPSGAALLLASGGLLIALERRRGGEVRPG